MKKLSIYTIAFKGLAEGDHLFDYDINDTFFTEFENSEVKRGELKARVKLTKRSTLLELEMSVDGRVLVMCDRCLDDYYQNISNQTKMIVKFGDEFEDSGDEIIVLPHEEHQVNVAQYLYELIILGLPIKKVHPDDENGEPICDSEMLKKLEEHRRNESIEKNDGQIDDRWSELKKLLDNK